MHTKSFIALGLALFLGVAATGCGSGSDSASASPTVPATTPSTTATTDPPTLAPPVVPPTTPDFVAAPAGIPDHASVGAGIAVDPSGNDITPSGPADVGTSSTVIPLNVPNRNDPKMRAQLLKLLHGMDHDWPWLAEVLTNITGEPTRPDEERIDAMIDEDCASPEARKNNRAMAVLILGPMLAPDLAQHDRTFSQLMADIDEQVAKAQVIIGCA